LKTAGISIITSGEGVIAGGFVRFINHQQHNLKCDYDYFYNLDLSYKVGIVREMKFHVISNKPKCK
jgi:hypothetical protein